MATETAMRLTDCQGISDSLLDIIYDMCEDTPIFVSERLKPDDRLSLTGLHMERALKADRIDEN